MKKQQIFSKVQERVGRPLLDVLYPPACPVCGRAAVKTADGLAAVCPPCRKKLVYIREPRCMKCGKALADESLEYCGDCRRCRHDFDRAAASFAYSDGIRQSVYRFKYQSRREYAKWYARAMAETCGEVIRLWQPQVLLPVPLHPGRLRSRGFNQAQLLAESLGGLLELPVETAYLQRVKRTKPMKTLNDAERIKNLENAFKIIPNGVKYKKVLLVDDIYTTGATVDACARVMKTHGVQEVYVACLCIGKGFI